MPDAVMQQVGNTWTFHLTGMAKQEGDQWTAWCPEIDVAAQGDTPQEAISALSEAAVSYIKHMISSGRMGEIIRPAPPEAYREFFTAGGENGGSGEPVQVSGRVLELTTA